MNIDIFEKLIEFEDKYSEDLMRWHSNGIHFWPCLRSSIFINIEQKFMDNLIYVRYNNNFSKLKYLYKILKNSIILSKNPYISLPNAEIIYIGSAINRILNIGGKKFDKYSDYFASTYQNLSFTIEYNYLGKHNPPEYISNIKYMDSVFLFSRLKKLFIKDKNQLNKAKIFINSVKQKLTEHFKNVVDLEFIISNVFCRSIDVSLDIAAEMYKLIKKTGCKFVLMEACCYGGYNSFLTMLLKMNGIKVIEMQHGLVSKKHIAYNYGKIPKTYLKYLPDYFLTYGQYWSDVLERLPVKKTVIGNPYLAEQVKIYNENEKRQTTGKKILVVSQTTVTDKFVALTKELRKLLPLDYYITFRLHPGEVQFRADRCAEIENVPGIEINQIGGICDCISTHDFIVGESSTTLFEAIPFRKTIFIMDTHVSRANIPQNIGLRFNTANGLADMILNNRQNEKLDPSYYWTLDWQENFNDFFQFKI